jgi:hypothetical protein
MSNDAFFKYPGNREDVKTLLGKYVYSEDSQFDEITLSFLGRWVWLYFENDEETNTDILSVKLSHGFTAEESTMFMNEMESLGFCLIE